jgi:hypothetical protein
MYLIQQIKSYFIKKFTTNNCNEWYTNVFKFLNQGNNYAESLKKYMELPKNLSSENQE